jgi:enterochelin esterase-like enzyme
MADWVSLREIEFESYARRSRTLWLQKPPTLKPQGVLLFLDGEYYVTAIGAPTIVAGMQNDGRLPPMLTAYLSHGDNASRWADSFCNEEFARYLAHDLVPWLTTDFDVDPGENILCGLSLTALSAVHAGLRYSSIFPRVITQSGSFWWNDGWLTKEVLKSPGGKTPAFRMTVGTEETRKNVTHLNEGQELIQGESQVDASRKMRDALLIKGYPVSYSEHAGGHDVHSWRATLEQSITAVIELV